MKNRRENPTILFRQICILLSTLYGSHATYIGCYRVSRPVRWFGISPGDYDPNNMNTATCMARCAAWKYKYAGATAARFCFCADSLPDVSKKEVDDVKCNEACSNTVNGDMCGSKTHVSVFRTPKPIQELVVAAADGPVLQIGAELQVNVQVTTDDGLDTVLFSMDYGDGAGLTDDNVTDLFRKTYATPGEHVVTVKATHVTRAFPAKQASVEILVQAPVTEVSLQCPEVVATHDEFRCNASVRSGSFMNVEVTYDDGTLDSFPIADAMWHGAGPGIPSHAGSAILDGSVTDSLYIMPNSEFGKEGFLVAYEYYANSTGTVTFLVMTPLCTTGNSYCYNINGCSTSCDSYLHVDCTGSAFCVAQSSCTDTCAARPDRYASAASARYAVKSVISHTISATGYGILQVNPSTEVSVSPGDIIGYTSDATAKLATRVLNAGEAEDLKHNSVNTAVETDQPAVGYTGTGSRHLLKAHASRPAWLTSYHTFTETGNHTVTLNVSNEFIPGWKVDSVILPVQEGINVTDFEPLNCAVTGGSVHFTLVPHSGVDINYDWDFGDGDSVQTSIPEATHIYNVSGEYSVTVVASNLLTSKDNTTTVCIQDVVSGIQLFTEPAPTNGNAQIWLNMTSGTEYACDWQFGDGGTFQTDYTVSPITGSFQGHTYTSPGTYQVSISCYNDVSRDTTVIDQVVRDIITGVDLVTLGALTGARFTITFIHVTGTDPIFTLSLDGIDLGISQTGPFEYTSDRQSDLPVGRYDVVISGSNGVSDVLVPFNFTMEEAISGAVSQVERDQTKVETGDPVEFSVILQGGSSVTVTWAYNDGSISDTFFMGTLVAWPPAHKERQSHTFQSAGVFVVDVIVSNNLDTFTANHSITVYQSVENLALETTSPVALVDGTRGKAEATFWFTTTPAYVPLTDAVVVINSGDDTAIGPVAFDVAAVHKHTYKKEGHYTVLANVSNDVDFMVLIETVSVLVPVTDMHIYVDPPHCPVGSEVAVGVSMLRGSEVEIFFDFGDTPGPHRRKAREATNPYEKDEVTHVFPLVGVYDMEIVATNLLGSTSMTYRIRVQHPVTSDFQLTSTAPLIYPPGVVSFELTLPAGSQLPTAAQVLWVWGDGTETGPVSLFSAVPGTLTAGHTYSDAGDYQPMAIIYNDASRLEFLVTGGVYRAITNVQATPLYRRLIPYGGPDVVGFGPIKDRFPLNREVRFHFTMDSGTVVQYMVEAVHESGDAVHVCNSTVNPVAVQFQVPGTYHVRLTAWNPVSEDSYQLDITLVEAVVGVRVREVAGATPKAADRSYVISFEKIGTGTCVTVDYGDGSSEVYGDDETACMTQTSAAAIADSGPDSATRILTVNHSFPQAGQYQMTVTGANYLSQDTASLMFTVSTLDCHAPTLDILKKTPIFWLPRVVQRNERFSVVGQTQLDCSPTLINGKSWQIFKVDPTTGETIDTIDMTSSAELEKTYQSSQLSVPPRFLVYGLYKFTFSVQMEDKITKQIFSNEVETFVEVIASQLFAGFTSGGMTRITRGVANGSVITLEPEKYSYDPDLEPSEDQGFTSFNWFCRHFDEEEERPVDENGDLLTTNPTTPLTVAELNNEDLGDDLGGCFRRGPGAVDIHSGNLSFPGENLHINETYLFAVEVIKDDRKAIAYLEVNVVEHPTPIVEIECALSVCTPTSEGLMINPNNRLSLVGRCEDCSPGATFSFTFFRMGLFHSYIEISEEELSAYVIGTSPNEIAIDSQLFADGFAMYHLLYNYMVRLTVVADGYSAVGVAYTNLTVNSVPAGGVCTVSPSDGVIMKTVFTISCPGWLDNDGIETYQYLATFEGDEVEKQITFTENPRIETELPLGPERTNYSMTIIVRIYDFRGAFTEVNAGVIRVGPLDRQVSISVIDGLLADDQNEVLKAAAEQNLQEASQVFRWALSVVNSAAQSDIKIYECIDIVSRSLSTGYGVTGQQYMTPDYCSLTEKEKRKLEKQFEEDRNKRAILRQQVVDGMARMSKPTPKDIEEAFSLYVRASEDPEEITRHTQNKMAESCQDMADDLLEMADRGEVSKERTQYIVTAAIAAISRLQEAANIGLENGLNEDIERSSKTEQFVYDTDLQSKRIRLVGMSMLDSRKGLRHETNKMVQTDTAAVVVPILVDTMATIGQVARNSLVPGEEMIIETDKIHFAVLKNAAEEVTDRVMHLGRNASVTLPHWCEINTAPDCSGDDVITLQASSTPFNKFEYLGNNISSLSGIINIDFYGSNGNKIPIKNTDSPILIGIPMDPSVKTPEPTMTDARMPNRDAVYLFYHSFNITEPHSSVHIVLKPDDRSVQLFVFVEFEGFPDVVNQTYDAMGVVDADSPEVFLDYSVVRGRMGTVVVGLRQAEPGEVDLYFSSKPLPVPEPRTGRITTNYTIQIFTTACYYYDEAKASLSAEGCEVAQGTTMRQITCSCRHLTMFGGGVTVQPNKIDFAFVFSNLDFYKNPTLYISLIFVIIFFLLALAWARRQDKKDMMKLGVTPLPDNLRNDRYLYEVTVQTGLRTNAATDSKVHFILSGEYDETDVRVLEDPQRKILRRGAVDTFLMATPRPLGQLNFTRIWHDNSGKGKYASWYLRYMVLQDLQTKEKFHFYVNKWFAVEEDDGQVDRLISVANSEQMAEFGQLFSQTSRKNFADEHIWFSVVARPPWSRFTRVQRVCCCLCLLYTSMLGNALFYDRTDDSTGADGFEIGPFSLTPQQIYVGVIVNLVVFPINFLIVFLFRKSKPKNKRPSRLQEALSKLFSRSDNSGSSQSDVKELLPASSPQPRALESPIDTSKSPPEAVRPMIPSTVKQQDDANPKKKKFSLPWWCRIVAWILLWLTVILAASFVLFYGIMFEDRKCKKWITSMVISFITSIFLTQPIKVFLIALLLSLVFKKVDDENEEGEEDEEQPVLQRDEEWIYPPPGIDGDATARPRKIAYQPPDLDALEAARQFRIKELQTYDVLREILFYALFLWLLMVISYGFRDPNSFMLRRGLKATFVDGGRPRKWSTSDNDFQKVVSHENYWNWAKDVLAPGLRADVWYNGQPPYGQRGFVGDRVGRIMGYATMRQLRVKPGLCDTTRMMRTFVPECNLGYDMKHEETRDHGVGWAPLEVNQTAKFEYIYREGSDINSYPFWGWHAFYSGGGYLVELTGDLKTIMAKMDELRSDRWIDRYTRAVFVEFTLYNAQANLFAIVTLLAEFMGTGGIHIYYRVEPVNLLGYYHGAMGLQIACEVTYLIFILIMIVKEIRNMYRQKWKYFKEGWNYLELMIICFSIAAVVIYFYRFLKAHALVKEFKETQGNGYTKFQYVGYWNEVLLYMVGWLVFMATIKFIRLLRFNKRMSLLASTLRYAANQLAWFGMVFFVVFFAYSHFFYMIYFMDLINFSNIVYSMETCLQMLVGKFNFTAMEFASPVLGPFVFFWYVVTVYFLLINMFVTILSESFATVRRDVSKQSNEHELVDFMIRRFKQWTGLAGLLGTQVEEKEQERPTGPDQVDMSTITPTWPVYKRGVHNVDHFPEKVDRLLDSITKVYFDESDVGDTIHGGANNKPSAINVMTGKYVQQPKRQLGLPGYARHQ